MLPAMVRKPSIVIVGAGNLGSALAVSLHRAGYGIRAIVAHSRGKSLQKAQVLAKQVGARAQVGVEGIEAGVIWICVPDAAISWVAESLALTLRAHPMVALHSSGALSSDEVDALRKRRASVASVHPLMTFVHGSRPSLAGVPFAIEGDMAAVRTARRIVRNLGGRPYSIRKQDKAAYHAWGSFASPLFTALLATSEQVATLAGLGRNSARQRMIPILRQTLANYASFGAAGAFSGPLIRGDVDTVRRHLGVLRKLPKVRDVYLALAHSALESLPTRDKSRLQKALRSTD